ncbi:hypothetical protein ACJX0J_033137 [Zea mays]
MALPACMKYPRTKTFSHYRRVVTPKMQMKIIQGMHKKKKKIYTRQDFYHTLHIYSIGSGRNYFSEKKGNSMEPFPEVIYSINPDTITETKHYYTILCVSRLILQKNLHSTNNKKFYCQDRNNKKKIFMNINSCFGIIKIDVMDMWMWNITSEIGAQDGLKIGQQLQEVEKAKKEQSDLEQVWKALGLFLSQEVIFVATNQLNNFGSKFTNEMVLCLGLNFDWWHELFDVAQDDYFYSFMHKYN